MEQIPVDWTAEEITDCTKLDADASALLRLSNARLLDIKRTFSGLWARPVSFNTWRHALEALAHEAEVNK